MDEEAWKWAIVGAGAATALHASLFLFVLMLYASRADRIHREHYNREDRLLIILAQIRDALRQPK